MVVLYAFMENLYSCGWFAIWQGDNLHQLNTGDFDYFKNYYGLENLMLRHEFYHDSTHDNDFVDYFDFDDFTEAF